MRSRSLSMVKVSDMGQKRKAQQASSEAVDSKDHFDPALVSLFAQSSGPVQPVKVSSSKNDTAGQQIEIAQVAHETGQNGVELSDSGSDEASLTGAPQLRARKRRRLQDNEGLEAAYFERLQAEESDEELRASNHAVKPLNGEVVADEPLEDRDHQHDPDLDVPTHESLTKSAPLDAVSSTDRTVFFGNVSTETIKDKSASRAFLKHVASPLANLPPSDPKHKLLSLRYRSTPFDASSGPKRAAYATKALMDTTSHSTNAYAVYSTILAAKTVATALNGTVINSRHLRADYLGKPTQTNNRRCVFVGNLTFVDQETSEPKPNIENPNARTPRPKSKTPADPEEGLWTHFGKAGRIESVRVVRDAETRVGKGFAYVQFHDENAVEAALLLDGKRFPPMLPRTLRVSRAKRVKTLNAGAGAGAGSRTVGMARGSRNSDIKPRSSSMPYRTAGSREGGKTSTSLRNGLARVFEGHRASSKQGGGSDRSTKTGANRTTLRDRTRPSSRALGSIATSRSDRDRDHRSKGERKHEGKTRPEGRSTRRAEAFRKGGGRKKRDGGGEGGD